MSEHGGGPTGPIGRDPVHPPPPPPPPPAPGLSLYVPDSLRAVANAEQTESIALIELKYAQAVAARLARAYSALIDVIKPAAGKAGGDGQGIS